MMRALLAHAAERHRRALCYLGLLVRLFSSGLQALPELDLICSMCARSHNECRWRPNLRDVPPRHSRSTVTSSGWT
jgi:hypothetical protein